MSASTEVRIPIKVRMMGRVLDSEHEDIFLLAHDSDIEKIKEVISKYDGDARKRSRSTLERIRLEGWMGLSNEISGGAGNSGVSGSGRGFSGAGCGFRGVSEGSLSFAAEPGATFRPEVFS